MRERWRKEIRKCPETSGQGHARARTLARTCQERQTYAHLYTHRHTPTLGATCLGGYPLVPYIYCPHSLATTLTQCRREKEHLTQKSRTTNEQSERLQNLPAPVSRCENLGHMLCARTGTTTGEELWSDLVTPTAEAKVTAEGRSPLSQASSSHLPGDLRRRVPGDLAAGLCPATAGSEDRLGRNFLPDSTTFPSPSQALPPAPSAGPPDASKARPAVGEGCEG